MKYIFLLIIFLFLNFHIINARTDTLHSIFDKSVEHQWFDNRIGGSASSFSGFGLSYQRHFSEMFVAKISVFIYGESYSENNDSQNLYSTFGGEFQYNLFKLERTRMHLFAALSFWYDDYTYYYNYSEIKRTWVTGIGFGFEFLVLERLSFNLETGLHARFGNMTRYSTNSTYNEKSRNYGVGIGGGMTFAF